MRAVRFHGRGDIRVDEIDEPVCGDGQVKVASISYLLS
jgi:threonine dehydrogenase-like Zn-dependent dehydrogenase